jgi:hypothetical protein
MTIEKRNRSNRLNRLGFGGRRGAAGLRGVGLLASMVVEGSSFFYLAVLSSGHERHAPGRGGCFLCTG